MTFFSRNNFVNLLQTLSYIIYIYSKKNLSVSNKIDEIIERSITVDNCCEMIHDLPLCAALYNFLDDDIRDLIMENITLY